MRRPHLLATVAAAAVTLAWGGAMIAALRAAELPDAAGGMVVAVFAPGMSADEAMARLVDAGGRPVRRTSPPLAWLVEAPEPGLVARLRARGAIMVLGDFPFGPVLAGCSGLGAPADP